MAPHVVLIHGASGNARTWQPLLPSWSGLAPTTVDLPGRGDAPGPPLSTVNELAAALVSTLPGPSVLVGHSLGGAVALQAALDHADSVSAVVLVSSSARLRVSPAILDAVAASSPQAPFRIDLAFGPTTPRAVVTAYGAYSDATPRSASLADWTACDTFDVRSRLGEVSCPVLVLHGDLDFLTPSKHQVALADALPHATRLEIGGAAHMLPWEAPEAVAEAVTRWLAGLDR